MLFEGGGRAAATIDGGAEPNDTAEDAPAAEPEPVGVVARGTDGAPSADNLPF